MVLIVVTVTTIFRLCYKDIQFFDGCAESRRYSLDLKPDSDNANVGKYMSEMIGFCVRAPCFLCELGAPLFTDADRRRMIQILYRPVFFVS